MFIQHITIENFGAILLYDTDLTQELNLIDSRYTDEIATAIKLLLCSRPNAAIPEHWIQAGTRISAAVCLENTVYQVCVTPQLGQLQLLATDSAGADVTVQYQYALFHCAEQDAIESFDGEDKRTPLRIYRYWCHEEDDDLSRRTERLADTKTFRRYLQQYIQNYRPEPINSQKKYHTTISPQGAFDVAFPGVVDRIHLSETEKRLFFYICFLNVAEFWVGFETLRDLHHEKKPLLIQNFVEFLDEAADIDGLIARTQKLHRQMIILTSPMDEELKKKWIGGNNGVFLKSCNAVCSICARS